MPRFHLRTKARPNEVAVEIGGRGGTAMVVPPAGASTASDNVRYLRLSNALHYAAAMADRLGTDVAVLDESETVYFIEDQDLAPLQPAS